MLPFPRPVSCNIVSASTAMHRSEVLGFPHGCHAGSYLSRRRRSRTTCQAMSMQLVVRRVPRYKPQFVRMKRPADALRRADSVKLTTQKPYLAQPWLLRKDDPEAVDSENAASDPSNYFYSKNDRSK